MSFSRRRVRGFTLIEVLFSLVILGLVMTTSLAAFYERENTIRFAEETVLVWQAISNEAEVLRFQPWHSLGQSPNGTFKSDLEILSDLKNVTTSVEVAQTSSAVKEVTLRVKWGVGRSATATVLRTDTGGTNLW
ncbi:MAG: prepilin-type N-terminal cleavage/methylation domain-containing protein [Acidobacteria bacterium]|nr:prepilin-type N-terminal cleavage/methylation domain-containing protein [Acidobacteriota bacterium]